MTFASRSVFRARRPMDLRFDLSPVPTSTATYRMSSNDLMIPYLPHSIYIPPIPLTAIFEVRYAIMYSYLVVLLVELGAQHSAQIREIILLLYFKCEILYTASARPCHDHS